MDLEWNRHAGIRKALKAAMANHLSSGLYIVFSPYHADRCFSFQEMLYIFGSPQGSFVCDAGDHR